MEEVFLKEPMNDDSLIFNNSNRGLSVVDNEGDRVYKQILHDIVRNKILQENLFLTTVIDLALDLKSSKSITNLFFELLKDFGKVFRLWLHTNYFLTYILLEKGIIRISSQDYTNKIANYKFIIYTNNKEDFKNYSNLLFQKFENYISKEIIIYVDFYYKNQQTQNIEYLTFNLEYDLSLPQINYPYLNNIHNYTENYIKNHSPILILMGEPGTGKTRFIKFIISKMRQIFNEDSNILFTIDPEVLNNSYFFINFMSSNSRAIVIEDMDTKLQARLQGNELMYNLLGISDGLINLGHKKMIFSTNLSSIKDIDSALIRKGRCYDILKFRKLNQEESYNFLNHNKKEDIKLEKDGYTLAELYAFINNNCNEISIGKIGF